MSLINALNIFSEVSEEIVSDSIFVGDYEVIQFEITATDVTSGFSIRFPGSTIFSDRLVDTRPDFNSVTSPTNPWNYIAFTGLSDYVNYNGPTGIVITSDGTTLVQISVAQAGITWIGAELFGRIDGTADVKMTIVDRFLN